MKSDLLILTVVLFCLALTGCEKSLNVTGVSPRTGSLGGGEPIAITGSGFNNQMGFSVYIGNNKTDNVSIQGSDTLIVHTPSSNETGTVDIRVFTDSGDGYMLHDAFTYIEKGGGAMDIRDLGSRKSHR